MTYQNEGEEIDAEGRRVQSSKSAAKSENAPAENQIEETEEEKRDEKVGEMTFFCTYKILLFLASSAVNTNKNYAQCYAMNF